MNKKWKQAIWKDAFPEAEKPEESHYGKAAQAFLKKHAQEKCPVVSIITELKQALIDRRISDAITDVHHMRGRIGNLLHDQRYWLAVSRAGHEWIHRNPAEARKHGWLAEKGEWNKQNIYT